jgi:hypothetical protein
MKSLKMADASKLGHDRQLRWLELPPGLVARTFLFGMGLVGTKERVRGHGLKIVLPTRLRTQR